MPASPAADEDFENARKRQIDNDQAQNQCGPPVKKARLSNGYENGFEPTPMDVDDDQNGDENAYPSPEQVPSPVIVTVGPEQGTQVDKVHELSTETTFLELSDDPSSRNAVLLQCEFNPRDPTILAAAGTDALARMWTLSRNIPDSGSESPRKPVFASAHNLLDESAPTTTVASGLSWSSDGNYIALSSEPQDEGNDGNSKVEFWDTNAVSFAEYNSFESPIICLRWNLANTACLAISPQDEGRGTLLTVMFPNTLTSVSFSLPNLVLSEQTLDATWTSNDEFFICGGDLLQAYHCTEQDLMAGRRYNTRENDTLSKITYDWHSRLLATANDSGMIDVSQFSTPRRIQLICTQIWDQSGQSRSFNAHQGLITSLVWQPVPFPMTVGDDMERLLASSGEDGAISIWNARSPDAKSKHSMTMGSAVVAVSFTPDGAFLAGATSQRVCIWKVDDVQVPRATWTRGDEVGWRTPQSQQSITEEDQFLLCWDANGQKLAYGVNSRVCLILSFEIAKTNPKEVGGDKL